MSTRLDELMTHLGTGKWSIFHFLALSYSNILITPHTLGRPFLAPKLDYTCVSSTHDLSTEPSVTAAATTTTESQNLTEIDHCYEADGHTPCTQWLFDTSTYTSTITSEFSLVCGREHLRTAYQSVYLVGVFFGAPVSGFLADKYGRRSMVAVSTSLYVVLAIGSSWLPDITAILVVRLVLGFLHAVVLLVTYILVVEIAEPRRRTLLGISVYMVWACSVMAWGGLAYGMREWRLLQTVASLPGVLFLPTLWFLDESPRWLAVQGRSHDAYVVLKKAARWNGATLPKEDEVVALLKAETHTASSQQDTSNLPLKKRFRIFLRDLAILMRTPRLRQVTLLMYVIYTLASMVYFGLSLSGGTLSDDPFAYMALSGLMEVPSYTVTVPVLDRLGRRRPGEVCFLFCGVALLALAAIPEEQSRVVMALALLGKMTNSAAFMIFFFHSSELFPTEVRSRGLGSCQCWSRIGGILAPYILDFVGSSRPWAASVVFGCASVIAAGCTHFLPETKGCALPDTVAQSEATGAQSSQDPHQVLQELEGLQNHQQDTHDA